MCAETVFQVYVPRKQEGAGAVERCTCKISSGEVHVAEGCDCCRSVESKFEATVICRRQQLKRGGNVGVNESGGPLHEPRTVYDDYNTVAVSGAVKRESAVSVYRAGRKQTTM